MNMLVNGLDERTLPALTRIAGAIHSRHGAPVLARDVMTAAANTNTGWLRRAAGRAASELDPPTIGNAIALLAQAIDLEQRGEDPGPYLVAAARAAEGDLDDGRDYLVVGRYRDSGGRYATTTRAANPQAAEAQAVAACRDDAPGDPLDVAAVIDQATGEVVA